MILTITFRSPSRTDPPTEPIMHERKFRGVPAPVVDTMVRDFKAYLHSGSSEGQRELYSFRKNGEEKVLALDFKEVVVVIARES